MFMIWSRTYWRPFGRLAPVSASLAHQMRFTGDGGNYMHLPAEDMQALVAEVPDVLPEIAQGQTEEEIAETNKQRARKRNENVKRLFDGLKGKFMKMFEDVEDQEIE